MFARMHAAQTFVAAAVGGVTEGVASKLGAGFAGSCCVTAGCGDWGGRVAAHVAGRAGKTRLLKRMRNFCKVGKKTRSLMGIVAEIIALPGRCGKNGVSKLQGVALEAPSPSCKNFMSALKCPPQAVTKQVVDR
jgi:hypothetical protein